MQYLIPQCLAYPRVEEICLQTDVSRPQNKTNYWKPNTLKTKNTLWFILIQFLKTCLSVKTSFCLNQMPVFFTFLNTRIWWGAYNQAVASRTTRPICMPLVVATTDLMFRKIFELLCFDKLHVEMVWCGSEGSYDDFCLWDTWLSTFRSHYC